MPGKSLNEWNWTLDGDFSLADELTGKQRRESLQNKTGVRKKEDIRNQGNRNYSLKNETIREWNPDVQMMQMIERVYEINEPNIKRK